VRCKIEEPADFRACTPPSGDIAGRRSAPHVRALVFRCTLSVVRVSTGCVSLAWLTACVMNPPPSHQVPPAPAPLLDAPAPAAAVQPGRATKPSARPLVVLNTCDDSAPPVVPASSLYIVVGGDPRGAVAASLGTNTTLEVPRHEGEELTLWLSRDGASHPRKAVVALFSIVLDVGCRSLEWRCPQRPRARRRRLSSRVQT
jgi:hypothetical protein